tara:strand:+ start:432 stop:1493 length:1062 start_codon:yes stop_codon:yes gene_type:complete
MTKNLIMMFCALLMTPSLMANEPMVITTWNIEHLGSPGRGFGGGFGGFGRYAKPPRKDQLPKRTDEQLNKIADLISTDLMSDIIALQEVAVTHKRRHRSLCKPLDQIVNHLESAKEKEDWAYHIPYVDEVPELDDEKNIHLGFMWNRKRVKLVKVFEMSMRDQKLAGKELFERAPLLGYFEEVRSDGSPGLDFVVVNVHLASGQQHDENHLIAMTLIEYGITRDLARHAISEPSVIIMGDFNENPNRKDASGKALTSPALSAHMQFKGYKYLTTPEMQFTRLNNHLTSMIDHILVNKSAQAHVIEPKATIYRPGNGPLGDKKIFPQWRATYSDHLPISFKIKSSKDNDSDFFD